MQDVSFTYDSLRRRPTGYVGALDHNENPISDSKRLRFEEKDNKMLLSRSGSLAR